MRVAVFALVFLALACVSRADESSKVVVLTDSSFDDFVAKTPLALVEFYAPWCGHCKALAPEYDAAAAQLEGKEHGKLAKVDCTVEKDLCSKYEVQGFPTIKLFRNDGSSPSDYDGARKADDLVKFMIRQSSPAVSELADADAVNNFAAAEAVRVVAFVGDENLDGYTKAANSLRNEYFFGVVKGNAAANAEFKVAATPAVVLLRNFDSGAVTYTGDFSDSEAIAKFIKSNAFPLVGEIGPENYAKYLERGFNFVWVFIDPENAAHATMITDAITPVAGEFKELSFVKLDGVKWAEHAKSFGLSGNTPGIVLEDHEKRKNYVFPESDAVTKDAFHAFIDGVLTGKISAHVKSEPEPADNSGPVKTVVGTSFERIVFDDTKDVFVEFYAPWCGHCKSLAPKYEQLGKTFAGDDTMVIAKIDATANDSPADIQGFPTLILYPAGDKSNPVPYEGDRTVKAMAKFLRANGKAGGRPSESAADSAADGEEPAESESDESDDGGENDDGENDGENDDAMDGDDLDEGEDSEESDMGGDEMFEELDPADFEDGGDDEDDQQGSDHGHSHGDGDDHGHAHGDHDDEL